MYLIIKYQNTWQHVKRILSKKYYNHDAYLWYIFIFQDDVNMTNIQPSFYVISYKYYAYFVICFYHSRWCEDNMCFCLMSHFICKIFLTSSCVHRFTKQNIFSTVIIHIYEYILVFICVFILMLSYRNGASRFFTELFRRACLLKQTIRISFQHKTSTPSYLQHLTCNYGRLQIETPNACTLW